MNIRGIIMEILFKAIVVLALLIFSCTLADIRWHIDCIDKSMQILNGEKIEEATSEAKNIIYCKDCKYLDESENCIPICCNPQGCNSITSRYCYCSFAESKIGRGRRV